MKRCHLLAAEIFSYSLANYENHLGIGNLRFDKLMPDDASTLERAHKESWPLERLARALDVDQERAAKMQRAYRSALEVVDAGNAAESFRWAVRQCIEQAIDEGLRDEPSIERLVTQICYRTSDLAVRLKLEKKSLSHYSDDLRREPHVEYGKDIPDE